MEQLRTEDLRCVGGFRLLGLLGVGGMGTVYLARGPAGAVALKVVRPEFAADPRFRARFRREVDTARSVSAAHTAAILDADPDAEAPWLASEYVPGPSLTEAVLAHGPLPPHTLRELARGLAAALAEVHAAGVVHRDVKPSNVLLALDGPRLIDFGVSRAIDDVPLTRVGAVVGSPGFLSPEQAVGREAGPAADVFSMAAVVAYAASGVSPFGAGSMEALLYRVDHEPPALGAVPEGLRELLERCLAKEPAARPSAAEVAAAIKAVGGAWLPEEVLRDIEWQAAELAVLEGTADLEDGAADDAHDAGEAPAAPYPVTATNAPRLMWDEGDAPKVAALDPAPAGKQIWSPGGLLWSTPTEAIQDIPAPGKHLTISAWPTAAAHAPVAAQPLAEPVATGGWPTAAATQPPTEPSTADPLWIRAVAAAQAAEQARAAEDTAEPPPAPSWPPSSHEKPTSHRLPHRRAALIPALIALAAVGAAAAATAIVLTTGSGPAPSQAPLVAPTTQKTALPTPPSRRGGPSPVRKAAKPTSASGSPRSPGARP